MTSMQAILIRCMQRVPTIQHHWYAIPLRLIVGYGFMEHGYAKLARGPESFAVVLHAIGVPLPDLLAWATVVVELLGGLAVLLGAFIPLASIPMIVVLLVAIFTVHLPYGFSSIKSYHLMPQEPISDSQAMRRISCISPVSSPWRLVGRVHLPWTS